MASGLRASGGPGAASAHSSKAAELQEAVRAAGVTAAQELPTRCSHDPCVQSHACEGPAAQGGGSVGKAERAGRVWYRTGRARGFGPGRAGGKLQSSPLYKIK